MKPAIREFFIPSVADTDTVLATVWRPKSNRSGGGVGGGITGDVLMTSSLAPKPGVVRQPTVSLEDTVS